MKKNTINKGFTLIEILIVIALLGALAVGMLAAIDPLEQFRKGSDQATRNTVSELYTGFTRYYAINSQYPWGSAGGLTGDASTHQTAIASVVSAGELKAGFVDTSLPRLTKIRIIGAGDSAAVCFAPESKMVRNDTNTKYNATGLTMATTNCAGKINAAAPYSTCYWCMQ